MPVTDQILVALADHPMPVDGAGGLMSVTGIWDSSVVYPAVSRLAQQGKIRFGFHNEDWNVFLEEPES